MLNGIEQVIDEAIKISITNQNILELIKNNSKYLFIEDYFEITKIFISKKNPNLMDNFTIEDFKKQDSDGYFQKILKGFCSALIDISQNELSINDKDLILNIIDKRVRG